MPTKQRGYKTILALTLLAIAGCGGGGAEQQTKVLYSDNVASGTVANYTDADWLFQNYLGEYGIPGELKQSFMPAMKLLANGFTLQLKTGQDVKTNIQQVHSMFSYYSASGEATKFFAQVQSDVASQATTLTTRDTSADRNAEFIEPVISEIDKLAIAKAKARDANERLNTREIAAKYGLPYQIEDMPEQWFIYSPTMKGGGKGGGGRSAPGLPKTHSDVKSWGWRRGDAVWANGAGSIPGVPGHNAVVWGEGTEVYFIDANTDVGVSLHENIQAWADRYTEIRALTPRLNWSQNEFNCYLNYSAAYGCSKDSYQRINAWWYAWNRQGYAYNWNFTNPRDTTKFYCSSIIWNAYDSVGYNIVAPWVIGSYGIITPSQIRDSGALVTFKVSTNSP